MRMSTIKARMANSFLIRLNREPLPQPRTAAQMPRSITPDPKIPRVLIRYAWNARRGPNAAAVFGPNHFTQILLVVGEVTLGVFLGAHACHVHRRAARFAKHRTSI